MRKLALVAAVFTLALGGSTAGAQTPAETGRPTLMTLKTGDTVRVWAVAPRLNGNTFAFSRIDARAMSVTELATEQPLSGFQPDIPIGSLRRVDVRTGKRRSGGKTAVGVLLGMAGGSLLGGIVGAGIGGNSDTNTDGLGAVVGFAAGGSIGLVAGGIVGGIIGGRRQAGWQSVILVLDR